MKTIYVKLFCVLGLILCISLFQCHDHLIDIKFNSVIQKHPKDYTVEVTTKTETLKLNLDDYLVGVLAGEMPANFELEALKAQAVASRTFVLSRHLKVDNTTNSQVYLTDKQMKENWGSQYQKYKEKITQAVKDTHNEVMTYKGEYISALFFSSSNGKTVNSEDYFGGEVAYLKAVDSHWDLTIDPTNTRTKTFTKSQIAAAFGISSPSIKIMSYTSSGYVKKVIINQKEYTGREVREKLNLASSCFQIELTAKGYQFTTRGSGHGVGMSQYGAQAMAKEKKTYQDILNHYYQNIKIESI